MNILFVAPAVPWPLNSGSMIRTYNLLKQISRVHTVFLATISRTSEEQQGAPELAEFCSEVFISHEPRTLARKVKDLCLSCAGDVPYTTLAGTSSELQRRLPRLIMEWQIECIQVQELYAFENLRNVKSALPVILDAHNCEALILKRTQQQLAAGVLTVFNRMQTRRMQDYERSVAQKVNTIFSVSKDEVAYFRELNDAVYLLPNGIAEIGGEREQKGGGSATILFTGTLSYPPNTLGLLWFLREVWPQILAEKSDVRVVVVGRSPGAELLQFAGERVAFITDAQDMQPFLQSATVSIVPLHAGGGTRLKILEAFAAGVPVVSTTIGVEGIDAVAGIDLLVGDSAEAFARHVLTVLASETLRAQLVATARRNVASKYLWKDLVQAVLPVYQRSIP